MESSSGYTTNDAARYLSSGRTYRERKVSTRPFQDIPRSERFPDRILSGPLTERSLETSDAEWAHKIGLKCLAKINIISGEHIMNGW